MKKGRAVRKKSPAKAVQKKTARTSASSSSRTRLKSKSAPRKSTARKAPGRNFTVRLKPAARPKAKVLNDLPFSYNKTKLALLVRDPEWGYSYWDFSAETWKWIEDFFHRDTGLRAKLRIHNLEDGKSWDLDVHLDAKNWYIQFGHPDCSFEAELGLMDSGGRFHRIAKSNRVHTPRNAPSGKIDPDWNPANFDELYKLSGGGRTGHGSEVSSMFRRS